MNAIVEEFDRLWRDAPARPLVHLPSSGTTLTTDDLQRNRLEQTAVLERAGIGGGHVVLSAVGNRPGFLALLLAAWSLGAVVLPVDEGAANPEIEGMAERFGAAAVVRGGARAGDASQRLDSTLTIELRAREGWQRYPGLALLKLTSGSSGSPKGVAVPPSVMAADTAHVIEAMDIRPDDTQIAAIPLSHAYGFGNLVLPLFVQGTAIVLREAFVPRAVVADAHAYRTRILPGVPFMFQHFAANPPRGGWPAPLTRLISAGAQLAPDVVRAFHDRFGVKVHSFYGTSETGGIAFDHSDVVDDTASVGWPMPGVTVELRADEDVPEGYGRVLVQGDAVAPGYVGAPADEGPFGGAFLTGDYGTRLADGRLVLAGRVSSFINVAGRKVQPAEIEGQLRLMEGVADARVLPLADPVRGEQVAAVVAGHATLARGAIRQFCAARLPPHKVPRVIVVVEALPLNARGKHDARAMQALVDAAAGEGAGDAVL
ncbi:MAG: class I adenylate-forming enzyme family protein [Vicinamibacterales bacterium]